MKKLNNIILYIIIFLFFSLPLINSHLLDIFGLKLLFYVNGNYEFTKVIFFNITSGIILLLFGIKVFYNKEKIIYPKWIFLMALFLLLITYFSTSSYTSLFGNTEKGHGIIMFFNLIGIFVILINIKERKKEILLKTSFISASLVGIIGIKELYYPTFEYGELSNRLVSTFGHPNYISLYLLLILPFISRIKSARLKNIFYIIYITTLLLTKSFIAIYLAFSYFYFIKTNKYKLKYYFYILITLLGIVSLITFYPEKLSSLISRFFIWETSTRIIFSDPKIFFIGGGLETFIHYFDDFKSSYLYIFEKIGFSADRPHNIIINFFYNFGILGLFFITTLYYKIFRNFIQPSFNTKERSINISLLLGCIFLLFNFASIASYLLSILIFSFKKSNNIMSTKSFSSLKIVHIKTIKNYFSIIIFFFSIFSIYYSTLYYLSEIQAYKNNYNSAIKIFPYNPYNYYKIGEYKSGFTIEKYKSEEYYITKIYSLKNEIKDCEDLVINYNSVENYFFCGNFLWEIGKYSQAKKFYNTGLDQLPDLWNKTSKYYDNIFIKNFISGNRFFSERYSNINQIIKRVGINKNLYKE